MSKLKIILLGETSVGKSSIIKRYSDNKFEDIFISTIGVDLIEKEITINGHKIILNIMDTSGQERFKSLSKTYIRASDGIIFVYDITNEESFKAINTWIKLADDQEEGFQAILVGNKIDLKDLREITKDEMNDFAEKNNLKCFETSAKENINIELIFKTIAELICTNSPDKLNKKSKNQKLKIEDSSKKKKCC